MGLYGFFKKDSPDRLIIFSRYPVPGKTKTRLIPHLGPAGAADLHRRLTEKTLDTVRSAIPSRAAGVEVCLEGGGRRQSRRWLGSGLIHSRQSQGDLGQRMYDSFLEAFGSGCRRVLLIGTDIPELSASHIKKAFEALNNRDIVLGPSNDGGYWLMGMKQPFDLFQGVHWGENSVLDQTISLAKRKGLSLELLDALNDIDTVQDLMEWGFQEAYQAPYISVIIPALNEEKNIEKSISLARDKDAEIILVDGGSRDKTAQRAIDSGARLIRSPRGRALQQNMGAAASRGKVLLFLHADTLLPRSYVNLIFEELMDPGVVGGGFRFRTDLIHPFMKIIEVSTNIRSRYLGLPYGDQAIFCRRSAFQSIGGFPRVPIAEDLALIRRLKKMGRISIAPAHAITSARRWRTQGLIRTTLINLLILAGCILRISPTRLSKYYIISDKKITRIRI